MFPSGICDLRRKWVRQKMDLSGVLSLCSIAAEDKLHKNCPVGQNDVCMERGK